VKSLKKFIGGVQWGHPDMFVGGDTNKGGKGGYNKRECEVKFLKNIYRRGTVGPSDIFVGGATNKGWSC